MPTSTLPSSAASERNKDPILDALRPLLPEQGKALEIGSGTGQHAAYFAAALPGWQWQPSDMDDTLFGTIADHARQQAADNVQPAIALDVRSNPWPLPAKTRFDLIYCANMLHIAPWECCAGLMQGASRHLTEEGLLVTYGPYLEDAVPPAPSNLAFDADLRQRDPAWGIRHLNDVCAEAEAAGLQLVQRVTMPANNLLLAFGRKTPALQTR